MEGLGDSGIYEGKRKTYIHEYKQKQYIQYTKTDNVKEKNKCVCTNGKWKDTVIIILTIFRAYYTVSHTRLQLLI